VCLEIRERWLVGSTADSWIATSCGRGVQLRRYAPEVWLFWETIFTVWRGGTGVCLAGGPNVGRLLLLVCRKVLLWRDVWQGNLVWAIRVETPGLGLSPRRVGDYLGCRACF